jgi:aryl-alcohol dehydrogenase-like predicted oxidoreductase
MDYVNLGRTGLSISPLVLGTVNFSWLTNEEDSFAIMDRALEVGVNFFDTSDNYNAGQTESLIGRWLAQGGGRREQVVLASKVYSAPMEWGSQDPVKRTGSWVGPNDRGLSAKHIRAAVEASLTRLQTDHLDIYQCHHVDRSVPWDELWQAMDILVQQGKILYVGSSNYAGWHIARAQTIAEQRGSLGFVSEQSVYNLMNRHIELEVAPACQELGLGLLTYSPLAGGVLGGKIPEGETGRRSFMQGAENERIQKYLDICSGIDAAPADVALAWVAHQEHVTAPIIGPRTMEQLEGALRALELSLDEQTLDGLDQLFPGPGGPAPEAYSW